jgi:hypothetical protein
MTDIVSMAAFRAGLAATVQVGFAFMEGDHRPGSLTDDEVAFPRANVGAGFDVLRPIMDGGAVFDHIARGSGPARPAALATARSDSARAARP